MKYHRYFCNTGNLSLGLKEKLNTAAEINVIFTTHKRKTRLSTLKLGFEKHLKSHVVLPDNL